MRFMLQLSLLAALAASTPASATAAGSFDLFETNVGTFVDSCGSDPSDDCLSYVRSGFKDFTRPYCYNLDADASSQAVYRWLRDNRNATFSNDSGDSFQLSTEYLMKAIRTGVVALYGEPAQHQCPVPSCDKDDSDPFCSM